MFILTVIATIIHMNHGFEFPEALGRGFISAFITATLAGLVFAVLYGIAAVIKWIFN